MLEQSARSQLAIVIRYDAERIDNRATRSDGRPPNNDLGSHAESVPGVRVVPVLHRFRGGTGPEHSNAAGRVTGASSFAYVPTPAYPQNRMGKKKAPMPKPGDEAEVGAQSNPRGRRRDRVRRNIASHGSRFPEVTSSTKILSGITL